MSPYDHQDRLYERALVLCRAILIGCVAIVTLVVAGRASVEAYNLLTDPPAYCVPSRPIV